MSSKILELKHDQAIAFSTTAEFLTKGASDDKCKDLLTILSVAAFQKICENRDFPDVRCRDTIIAEISHHVEYILRDFNEWEIEKYKRKLQKDIPG
jgi:hypothetical protein